MRYKTSQHVPPVTISPTLLAGLALNKIPVRLMQPILNGLLSIILRRHPNCLERIADWGKAHILIDPTDLPLTILLRPDPRHPSLTALSRENPVEADAVIRGTLAALIELVEGRVDGDSLFFSRELIIEGNIEVILALRNAVDAADINVISDISAVLGPMAGPFRAAAVAGKRLATRAHQDLATLGAALIAPALRRNDTLAFRIAELEEEVKVLRIQRPRTHRNPVIPHDSA